MHPDPEYKEPRAAVPPYEATSLDESVSSLQSGNNAAVEILFEALKDVTKLEVVNSGVKYTYLFQLVDLIA